MKHPAPLQHRDRTRFHPMVEPNLEAWYDVSAVENSGNYLKRSEEFNDAAWTKNRIATFGAIDTGLITAGSFANTARTLDPIGGYTADFIQEDSTLANSHHISQSGVSAGIGSYRCEIYVKGAGRTWVRVGIEDTAGTAATYFDVANLVVGGNSVAVAGSVVSANISDAGNGWSKILLVVLFNAPFLTTISVRLATGNGLASYNGDNESGVFLWGASVQLATWDSRYIPTGANPILPNAQADAALAVVNLRNLAPCYCQRGNLLLQSETFEVTWLRTNINAFGAGSVANTAATLDPLGGNTADFIQENNAAGDHSAYQLISNALDGRMVLSCYFKKDTRSIAAIGLRTNASAYSKAWFDLNGAGSVLSNSAAAGCTFNGASISNVGNSWFKCSLDITVNPATHTADYALFYNAVADGSTSYLGDNTSGLFLWGAQLRRSSWSDQYIKTTTDTVTPQRNGSFRDLYQGTGSAQPLLTRSDNRGNLLLQSEAFNTTWTLGGIYAFGANDSGAATAGSFANTARTTDPLGGNTADFMQEDNGITTHGNAQTIGVLQDGSYDLSLYYKPDGRDTVRVYLSDGTNFFGSYFNTLTLATTIGSGGTGSVISRSVTAVGGGWFLCTVRGQFTAVTGSQIFRCRLATNAPAENYNGDTDSGGFFWGASLRRAEWEETYVQTTSFIQHPGINLKPTLLFNGTTHYLKTPTFTLQRPSTVYIVFRPVSITAFDRFFDGVTSNTMGSYQSGANRFAIVSSTDIAPTDAYPIHPTRPEVAAFVFNGTWSSIDAERTYDASIGVLDAMGFTLAAQGDNSRPSDIQFCECLIFSGAHDINARNRIRRYLTEKWGPKAT